MTASGVHSLRSPADAEHLPLSSAQQRLWFLDQAGQLGSTYNMPTVLRLRGTLDRFALERSFFDIVRRHDILRTRFGSVDGIPHQIVGGPEFFCFVFEDLIPLPGDQREQRAKLLVRAAARHPFDLSRGPLFRVLLLRVAEQEHILVMTMHHIVGDAWSELVIAKELRVLYEAHASGRTSPLPEPRLQYSQYALWQQRQSATETAAQLQYWRSQLRDFEPLKLPVDRVEPITTAHSGDRVAVSVSDQLSAELRRLGAQHRATMFMVLLAAFKIVLSRYTGQEDIVVGAPSSGRTTRQFEDLIGVFVNSLVLRTRLHGNPTFVELLARVKAVTLDAHDNGDVAFERLVAELQPERVKVRDPIFRTVFSFENVPGKSLHLADVQVASESGGFAVARHDLLLHLVDAPAGLHGFFEFPVELFERATIERIARSFELILQQIIARPTSRLGSYDVLDPLHREQMLVAWNNRSRIDVPRQLVHELFDLEARRAPDATAVIFANEIVTYSELNRRASQVASGLSRLGIGVEDIVGISAERRPEMLVGMLGILKAGAAYLPLEPDAPRKRIEFMVADAHARAIVTFGDKEHLLGECGAPTLSIDALMGLGHIVDAELPQPARVSARNLAYVIYTSGSTGNPKAVMVEHAGLLNYVRWAMQKYPMPPGEGSLVTSSLAFDATVTGLYLPLLAGHFVMLAPANHKLAVLELVRQPTSIALMKLTPSELQVLAEHLQASDTTLHVDTIVIGGEALSSKIARSWHSVDPRTRLFNEYGPTEAVVGCTVHGLRSEDLEQPSMAIGQPIANAQIYILDRHGEPAPAGVQGEIWIGGSGVVRGYLGQPALTAEQFVPDPFSNQAGARMYRTGDRGRWRPDGNLEFHGRNDRQLKIGGVRIELAEIEARLIEHPGVTRAVATSQSEDATGMRRIAAHVEHLGHRAPTAEELREHLRLRLPEVMIPSSFVFWQSLPLNNNGKVDLAHLAQAVEPIAAAADHEMPEGDHEWLLAGIWQELLGIDRIGRRDNFFGLGGHSLLTVRMLAKLKRAGLDIGIQDIFESRTLSEMAARLRRVDGETFEVSRCLVPIDCESIVPAMLPLIDLTQDQIAHIARSVPGGMRNIADIYPLAPVQEGILFHHLLTPDDDTYLLSLLLEVDSSEHLSALVSAIQQVVDRHDILRTAVLWEGLPRPVQVVYRHAPVTVHQLEIVNPDVEAMYRLAHVDGHRLDLTRAPLISIAIASAAVGRYYVLLQRHHIVEDRVSNETALQEIAAIFAGRGQELRQPTQYREYVAHCLAAARNDDGMSFFSAQLGNVEKPTAPFGIVDVYVRRESLHEVWQTLDAAVAMRVRAMARREGVSPAAIFHAAWALVLARCTSSDDVVLGTVVVGRVEGHAASPTLGMFINTLPLRLELAQSSPAQLLRQVQAEIAALLRYHYVPLGLAQRCSNVADRLPLFTSIVNYRHISPTSASSAQVNVVSNPEWTNYPITICVDDLGVDFSMSVQTDKRIHADELHSCLLVAIDSLLGALDRNDRRAALTLEVMPAAELARLVAPPPATLVEETPGSIHGLFEARAREVPEATAVIFGTQQLTFDLLNRRANQLAHRLRQHGAKNDVRVGIYMERGVEMVIAMLAVLKAGAAYVPFDARCPEQRLQLMLADSGCTLLLTQFRLADRISAVASETLFVDSERWLFGAYSSSNPECAHSARSLAYVLYTSGSTGTPKGVMIEHRSVLNFLMSMLRSLPVGRTDRVMALTSLSFDIAALEIYLPLSVGATMVIADAAAAADGRQLVRMIDDFGITLLQATPATWRLLLSAGWAGRAGLTALCGGEALTGRLSDSISSRAAALWNLYGPTETTIWSCAQRISRSEPASYAVEPIGTPIENTRVYVLNEHLQVVPAGAPGEIYISGVGVGRGYIGNAAGTAERFIPDPFWGAGERMYRTGDLGTLQRDGTLLFLGRMDAQVKIRGYRVEIGEVELALTRLEGVLDAVVVARHPAEEESRTLAAFLLIEPTYSPSAETLRKQLARVLPEYMIPSAFEILDSFPLLASGKIDRGALIARAIGEVRHESYTAPSTRTEVMLCELWREVLHLQSVGVDDNFFTLGGHSLVAMSLVMRAGMTFGIDLPLSSLFSAPTPRELAVHIDERTKQQSSAVSWIDASTGAEDIADDGTFPLTDVQQAYSVGRHGEFVLGNVAAGIYMELDTLDLDIDRLESAWHRLVERHANLRTIVHSQREQRVLPGVERHGFLVRDLRDRPAACIEAALLELRDQLSHQILPLDRPLYSISVTLLPERAARLHFYIDLIICDAWSFQILSRDLAALYQDPHAVLPRLEFSFRSYVLAEHKLRETDNYARAWQYWISRIDQMRPAPSLPLAVNPVELANPRFGQQFGNLPAEAWSRVKALAAAYQLTPTVVLLAAYADVLQLFSGDARFTINLTLFNRLPLHPDVESIVGDFTSLLPLDVSNEAPTSFLERARSIQRTLWEGLDHRIVSGVAIMRERARRSGNYRGGDLPVIFTSTLGLEGQQKRASKTASHSDTQRVLGKTTFRSNQTPQVWLDLQVSEYQGQLTHYWSFVENMFPEGLLTELIQAFVDQIHALARGEHNWQVEQLPSVPTRPTHDEANATERQLPLARLEELVLAQVPNRADSPAVIDPRCTMTYRELESRSRAIAYRLQQGRKNHAAALIPIVMHRGWEQIVAVLGVLRSGHAYVPIDPAWPEERRNVVLRQCGCADVLTQSWLAAELTWPAQLQLIAVDRVDAATDAQSIEPPSGGLDELAYVIYTSGSTGVPKGVMISHRSAANTVLDVLRLGGLTASDRVLAVSALTFDLSVFDIFGLLCCGGAVVLPRHSTRPEPEQWLDLIHDAQVTIWNSVPALAQILVEAATLGQRTLPALRLVLLSGDWVPLNLPPRLRCVVPRPIEIIALGGATEAAIWSIYKPVHEVDPAWRSIPYGRAMSNQKFHVLDAAFRPCPTWVPGELYIAGAGLAMGYFADAQLTSQKFPISAATGERLYRTGDLGRWLPDGDIEFLGRRDNQTKILGHRIELGEIEAVLARGPGIRQALVNVAGTEPGEQRIIAYLVPEQVADRDSPPDMQFSLFYFADARPEGAEDLYDLYIEGAKFADSNGLLAVWTPERHFTTVAAAYPNPAVLNAALAMVTKRVRLRAGSVVLPLHHPVRVAEEWSVVDRLSGGRVDLSFAAGWLPDDFVLAPGHFKTRHETLLERVDQVKRLWRGEAIELPNGLGQLIEVKSLPRPVQSELDVWITCAKSKSTFEAAGRSGANVLTSLLSMTIDELAEALAAYRRCLIEGGHDPDRRTVTVMLHVFVAPTDSEAIDKAREPLTNYFRSHAQLRERLAKELGDAEAFEQVNVESALAQLVERYLRSSSLIGSVETCQSMVQRLKQIGVGEIAGLIDFGIDSATTLANLPYLKVLADRSRQLLDPVALRAELKKHLPEYMIPHSYITLERLPLSANGKVDRAALPVPAIFSAATQYLEPRTALERAVANLWLEMLHAQRVGANDNFFELGGHSVLAIQATARLEQQFGVKLSLGTFFEKPTVKLLASHLEEAMAAVSTDIEALVGELEQLSEEEAAALLNDVRQGEPRGSFGPG